MPLGIFSTRASVRLVKATSTMALQRASRVAGVECVEKVQHALTGKCLDHPVLRGRSVARLIFPGYRIVG
jgi:hypothetical protein